MELIYCVINSEYSLKATYDCALHMEFYKRLMVQSSMSSNHNHIVAIFSLNLVMRIIEYFVYKRVFGFPTFCLYYLFMKLFLFQSKTKDTVNGID